MKSVLLSNILTFLNHRYLQRTVKHPTLLQDPDLRQFLESSEVFTFFQVPYLFPDMVMYKVMYSLY